MNFHGFLSLDYHGITRQRHLKNFFSPYFSPLLNQFESHENFKQASRAWSIKNKRQIKKEINRQITGCG